MAKKKKRKLKIGKILLTLLMLTILLLILSFLTDIKINNILVKNNILYSDWQIIKKAGLSSYPSALKIMPMNVQNKLEKDIYIKDAKVYKRGLNNIVIEVKENLPLFYYLPKQKTILMDKTETGDNFSVPTVINYVPDKVYAKFLKAISSIDYSIIKRISEIKYDPNEVDNGRFFLTMNDGNQVYLTLNKFSKLDDYLDIIKEFNNKKGILYLDSGEYFEVKE
ncbi:MAG: FtsQ-type POTRA domain-containing protein [Bacilli bacterium]|nr:FtsQ-type POTRA domain-containing protein [Bacilli bacterium]